MVHEYIEAREGGYYLAGSRVSLDSVVYEFLKGETPEGILQSFPSLSLEQVARSRKTPRCFVILITIKRQRSK